MKILVPVKLVASIDEDCELREDGRDVDPDFLDYELNEWDDYSWEEAVRLQEAHGAEVEIIPVTVGPAEAEDGLRRCLAKGGERAIRVWHDALEASDPMAVARVIAKLAKRENADLVLAGTLSSDHGFAATGMCVASLLGWAHAAVVSRLDISPGAERATVRRELEAGLEEEISVQCPAVLTIQLGINEPRYASLRGIKQAKAKPLEVVSHIDLGLEDAEVGESGSLSRVRRMFAPERGQAELIEGTPAEQAARIAAIVKQATGGAQ
ncbi:MAG: electron transfer flavoprotein subunit beta/FixA family protein [Gammaproteobacteria bacterium]|nr:electron transfer flavoprotein subunit beta/FixA family protein [Gammaproteobacteria bacterium]